MEDNKHLYLNFSERINSKSTTYSMIKQEKNIDDVILNVKEYKLQPCVSCGICKVESYCYFSLKLKELVDNIMEHQYIHFCFPVYCNAPSPSFISLMSILSTISENCYNRKLGEGKNAYIHVISDVSGTQSSGMIAMSQLNMIGFNIPPRAVREYIRNWKDRRIRGGDDRKVYMVEEDFKTKTEKE